MMNIQGLFSLEGKILGKGAFGVVYLGMDLSKNRYVALKKIPRYLINDPDKYEMFSNEILVSSGVKHENLVNIIDLADINNEKYIAYEYCNGGDLGRYLKFFTRFDETFVQYCLTQLLKGLQALHSKKIIHHDIKPENILIDLFPNSNDEERKSYLKILNDIFQSSNNGMSNQYIDPSSRKFIYDSLMKSKIKLSDFGLSKYKGESNQRVLGGSPAYMDPNMFIPNAGINIIENEKVDIWALGVFAYELFFGCLPFGTYYQDMGTLMQQLRVGRYMVDIRKYGKVSVQFLSFLGMCLKRSQNFRANVTELLFSEFITMEPSKFTYIDLNNRKYVNSNGQIILTIDKY